MSTLSIKNGGYFLIHGDLCGNLTLLGHLKNGKSGRMSGDNQLLDKIQYLFA